jgi:hypothetical protein
MSEPNITMDLQCIFTIRGASAPCVADLLDGAGQAVVLRAEGG